MRDSFLLSLLMSFLAGVIFTLGYPNFLFQGFFPFAPLGLIGLVLLLSRSFHEYKRSLLLIYLFNLGHTFAGFYWLNYTLQVFAGLHSFWSFVALFIFALIVRPQLYLSLLIIRWLNRYSLPLSFRIILYSSILTWLDHYTPQIFPVPLGQSLLPLGQLLTFSSMIGSLFYSFILYWAIALFFAKFHFRFHLQKQLLAITALISISLLPLFQSKDLQPTQNLNLRIVQANIGNFLKIQSELGSIESLQEVSERYLKLSQKESDHKIDLIIWPETAYPYNLNTDQLSTAKQQVPLLMQEIIQFHQAQLLTGGYDTGQLQKSRNNLTTEYNSVFHFDPKEGFLDVYHKNILLMFGETLPFGRFNPQLRKYFPGVSLFAQGAHQNSFLIKNQFRTITPICYEILKPHYLRNYLNASYDQYGQWPQFITNLTNDSWYGKTAEPYQHLFLARWRALEFSMPIVRATNTGISAIINRYGEILKYTEINSQENLDFSLPLFDHQPSLYQLYGDWIFLIMNLLILLIASYTNRKSLFK